MRQGIAIAGNIVVDAIKQIDNFPTRLGLVTIRGLERSLGGSVCNVGVALANFDSDMPIALIGLAGQDGDGDYALAELGKYPNIDLSGVLREGRTAFTDVLAEEATKERTFLHYRGANSMFGPEHIGFDTLNVKLLHIAYILLLDKMDSPDAQYGTQLARALHMARQRGILTCVDVVSEVGERFSTIVPPALKYADYVCINEIEAGGTVGFPLRDEHDALIMARIPQALAKLKAMGVSKWAVIHTPEGGFGMDEQGQYVSRPGLMLPPGFIKGTVGAGDAFCAGLLRSIHEDEPLGQALEDAIACAASSLSTAGSTEGTYPVEKARALYRETPKREM